MFPCALFCAINEMAKLSNAMAPSTTQRKQICGSFSSIGKELVRLTNADLQEERKEKTTGGV